MFKKILIVGCGLIGSSILRDSFNKKICKAVDLLSRRKGEKYNHYIDRLKDNNLAVTVKLADLIDNFSRRKGYKKASKVDLQKIKKYKKFFNCCSH